MPDSFDYPITNSENARLLQALIDEAPSYTQETNSRNANILKSIINNTEYTDAPQSEIEELLLRLKVKIGGEIEVDELTVTENGIYDAGVNKAYNPVTVELPLDSKTITENGTYTASDDNLEGFDEVTVAVEGYAKKSIPNTPTDIATFNASAMPMPSLSVGIEATQSGSGDPSPQNVRPITGFSAVNVTRAGKNLLNELTATTYRRFINPSNQWVVTADSSLSVAFYCKPNTTYTISYDNSNVTIFRVGVIQVDPATVTAQTVNLTNVDRTLENHTVTTSTGDVAIIIQINREVYEAGTSKLQVETGTTATTYEAYNGTTTPIAFTVNGETKTIYSGYVEVKNGKVEAVATHYMQTEDGTKGSWAYNSQRKGFSKPLGSATVGDYAMKQGNCQPFKANWLTTLNSDNTGDVTGVIFGLGNQYVFVTGVEDIVGTTVTDWNNYLTQHPLQLWYELATPIEYDLADVSISTQDGTNNLWADSGDVLSGEYMEAL